VLDNATYMQRPQAPGEYTQLIPGAYNPHFLGGPISINRIGLRGEEVDMPKPEGTTRILAVGDSVTFGYAVAEEEAWPEQLEHAFEDQPLPGGVVEAVNAGVPGTGLLRAAHFLDASCEELEPDLVLLAVGLNDVLPYDVDDDGVLLPRPAASAPSQFRHGLRWLLHRSQLAVVLRPGLKSFLFRAGLRDLNQNEGYDFPAMRAPSPEASLAWERSATVLGRIVDRVETCGAPLVLVVFPLELQLGEAALRRYRDDYGLQVGSDALSGAPQDELQAFATARGVGVLDLWEAFEDHGPEGLYLNNAYINIDPVHPSARGHAVAGRAIFEGLTELGWPTAFEGMLP